jgi:hypothetical protein
MERYSDEWFVEEKRKLAEQKKNAVEVKPEDVKTMLFCEEIDDNESAFFSDMQDYLDQKDYLLLDFDEDNIPQILWVTKEQKISIDADWIVESATEEMCEQASEMCDIKGLQILLDEWCAEQTGLSYEPCYEQYVVIPYEEVTT